MQPNAGHSQAAPPARLPLAMGPQHAALALAAALAAPSAAAAAQRLTLKVDGSAPGLPFPKIWEATGWCPPDATSSALAMHNYSVQEANWQNHAFIAAVPNQGLKYVRIHDLLNLVTINADASAAVSTHTSNLLQLLVVSGRILTGGLCLAPDPGGLLQLDAAGRAAGHGRVGAEQLVAPIA